MADKDKIRLIHSPKDVDEMEKALAEVKRSLPILKEYVKITAELRRVSYDAHIKEGFSKQEALYLCHQSADI